jgi:hypothetical protein
LALHRAPPGGQGGDGDDGGGSPDAVRLGRGLTEERVEERLKLLGPPE